MEPIGEQSFHTLLLTFVRGVISLEPFPTIHTANVLRSPILDSNPSNLYATEGKWALTEDRDVERSGRHAGRRLWSVWSQVQLSLTPELCSAVFSVQDEPDGGRHIHRSPDLVAAAAVLRQAARHLQSPCWQKVEERR